MTFDEWWAAHGGEFDPRAETVFAHLWDTATKAERERAAAVGVEERANALRMNAGTAAVGVAGRIVRRIREGTRPGGD